jgi:hypothetical protein
MGSFARSWGLFKTSLGVVKKDKELLWMPILSGLATLLAVAAVTGIGLGSGVWPETSTADGQANVPGIALAAVLYILLAFVTLFFNAAVVAAASERLAGGDPTIGSGLRAAWAKKGRLFVWAIAIATVNVILQAIRERSGALGRFLASVGGIAWNLATYFMVPTLLFENESMGGSVKRSASLFKKTWGETVIGQGGLGLIGFAFTFAVIFVGVFLTGALATLGTLGLAMGVAITIVGVLTMVALFSVLEGVYKAALYRYAATGQAGEGFTTQQLGGAFTHK